MKKKSIIIIIILLIIAIIALCSYIVFQKIQKENRKYEIETISEYKYFVVREENKYGVIDNDGNKVIDAKYEDVIIPNPERAVFICYENNSTIVLNENGEKIFAEYENVEPLRLKNISSDLMYEKSTLKYSKDGKYGIIDFNGKKITNALYEQIDTLQFKEGELLVKKSEKYGVINIKGATLVKTKYDSIETDKFYTEESGYKNSGYIVRVTTDEGYRYGYVDLNGKEVIETKYNDLYRILETNSEDVYIICAENGKYGLINNNKLVIENLYQSLTYAESNKTIVALKGKKYGVLSIDGDEIVPFEYKQIDITGQYIYATDDSDNVKVFNTSGERTELTKEVVSIDVKNTNYKINLKTTSGRTIYSIYNENKKITKTDYTYIQYLFDNYFIACDTKGKLGIINDSEKTIIEFIYDSIHIIENTNMVETLNNSTNMTEIYSHNFKKICELENATLENNIDYIKLYNKENAKYISKDEKEVKNTDVFTKNKIFAKQVQNKWGFADINGNKVVDYKYDKVTEVNEYGFAGIKQNDKWGVINSNGEIIVEPTYKINSENPIFIGEYYQVIYGNGEIYYTK